MRALTLGLFAAISLALAVPALAEEIRVGVPGIGVEIGPGHRDGDRDGVRRDRDRDEVRRDRDRDGVRRTDGFERRSSARCETTTITREDGSVKTVKKCRD